MRNMQEQMGWRRQVWTLVLFLVATGSWGGFIPPLYVGNLEPVRDQFGRAMVGSPLPSKEASRALVEIRTTTDGIIRPPTTNGVPHPFNPLLTPDSIGGMGLNAATANSGIFCMAFSERPATGTKIFARAYNAPTREAATFYADSALVDAPKTGNSLVLEFGTAKAMDPGDDDNDGLNNAWEATLGTDDRLTSDYDGDGMSDLHEWLAGTALDDPDSKLSFRLVQREGQPQPLGEGGEETRPVRVRWQSVPGKSYRLEYVLQLVPDPATGLPHEIIPVGDVVTAGAGEYEIDMVVDLPEDALTGVFRVKLVTE